MNGYAFNDEEERIVNYINNNFSSVYAVRGVMTQIIAQSGQHYLQLDVGIFRSGDKAEFKNLIGSIELDGSQHYDLTNHKQIANDAKKNKYFDYYEIPFLRTNYQDSKKEMYERINEFVELVIANTF